MSPNLERIKKWVDALRSGDYQQTQGMLHDSAGGYCCLGVACEVYNQETGRGSWDPDGPAILGFREDSEYSDIALTSSVRTWFGLDQADPMINEDRDICASELNDDGMCFADIAILLEETYGKM